MQKFNNLSQQELLHLAIEATKSGEHGAAISYLKEGVERFPEDGKLAYILGAEFAQIGLYEQAELEMEKAIVLEPHLYTASFQLGLLQMTLGKVREAKDTWKKLEELSNHHALRLFKEGLEKLSDGEFSQARQLIEKGIQVNDFSLDLTQDMKNVLLSMPSDETEEVNKERKDVANHIWLSAYSDERKT